MKTTEVLSELKRRFPNEPEYHQAVEEVLSTIEDVYNEHPEFDRYNLIERLCIPDRMFSFRVTWVDDKGQVHTNMDIVSNTITPSVRIKEASVFTHRSILRS